MIEQRLGQHHDGDSSHLASHEDIGYKSLPRGNGLLEIFAVRHTQAGEWLPVSRALRIRRGDPAFEIEKAQNPKGRVKRVELFQPCLRVRAGEVLWIDHGGQRRQSGLVAIEKVIKFAGYARDRFHQMTTRFVLQPTSLHEVERDAQDQEGHHVAQHKTPGQVRAQGKHRARQRSQPASYPGGPAQQIGHSDVQQAI